MIQRRLIKVIFVLAFLFIAGCGDQNSDSNLEIDQAGYLRVKGIIVEDERGVERIVIGAPTPPPRRDGEVIERRSEHAGILLNDADGNERGGFGMLEDGTVSLMLDHPSRDGAGAVVWRDGGAEVRAAGKRGLHSISAGVTPDGFVGLYVVDPQGELVGRLHLVGADGKIALMLEDENGTMTNLIDR